MVYILTNKSPLWLKKSPNKESKNIGVIKPGELFTVNNEINDWYQIKTGYLYKFNSDGDPVADNDINKISHYNDKDNENTETLYDRDMFPSEMTSWTEGNRKYTVMPSQAGDGTYTQVVSYEVNGELHNDTYVYSKDGGTLSSTHTTGPAQRQNRTVINADGTKTVEEYININGVDTKVTSTYDASGQLTGQSTQPTYADSALLGMLRSAGLGGSDVDGNNLPLTMTTIAGIHGIPYQFMDIVDSRNSGGRVKDVGRMFADRIVARMPLFIISPGEPEFLAGWSEEERAQTLKSLLSGSTSGMNQIFSRPGRYYTFKARFDLYANYLNSLMQAAAIFLGIEKVKYNGGANFGSYRWENNYNKDIHAQLNYHQAVAFYIHADTQINDSFTNDTRPSQLADKINGLSDLAKEVQFLTGTTGAMAGIGALTDLASGNANNKGKDLGNVENMTDFTNEVLGSGDFIKAITGNIATIIQGGKLIFPEIWGDSQYTKTYSVTIKLRCPNPDPVSWYLDIWAPVAHLLPMVLPKMSGPNGYVAPFLVRAYYKGLFNCQMGIISNMSVTRGDMGNWTLNGLPTSVDINLEIKDLYKVMGIGLTGQNNNWTQLINNIGMLDYVANFCGININVPDFERILAYGLQLITNTPGNIVGRLDLALDTWVNNIKLGILGRR